MLEMTEYPGFFLTTMPTDAMATSAGMVLTVKDGQPTGLNHCEFGVLLFNKIQDMVWNVNIPFYIFKTFQHEDNNSARIRNHLS